MVSKTVPFMKNKKERLQAYKETLDLYLNKPNEVEEVGICNTMVSNQIYLFGGITCEKAIPEIFDCRTKEGLYWFYDDNERVDALKKAIARLEKEIFPPWYVKLFRL